MMMDVRIALSETERADVYKIRRSVFIDEQGVPESVEIDDKEEQSIHFIFYKESQPVGAARLRLIDQAAKAERVCILSSERSSGLGRLLMDKMEETAKQRGAEVMRLNAQTHAEAFYLAIGYTTVSSSPFLDAGIEHVTMEKRL
ncbi:GNAT family N-acetyltransferase [Alkalicoccus halolimnae]|uniref:GNAT family N-acetyltransferase n=1 Tax=Alkalicoccus halolimnae TaxID=1667239 RepID=A0AAJ8LU29_9BACI